MILIAANNAQTTLAGGISNVATSANLQSGAGALFPNPTVGEQYFVGTFVDAATGLLNEIVWATQRVGDTITIIRGQESTTARAWSPNDLFGNLMTAGQLETMVQVGQLQGQEGNYGVDTGSTDAVLCVLDPVLTIPIDGMPVRVLIANNNTGPFTFNPGTGAANVLNPDGSDPGANQIVAGGVFTFYWNSNFGKWQLGDQTSPSAFPPGFIAPTAGLNQPTGWYLMYGQTASRSADSSLFASITRSSVVTIPIASPGIVTWVSHGLENGSRVSFETSGTLPSGLTPGIDYFVVSKAPNTFEVATTVGGSAINFTGSESGTQTCRFNPWGCGNGTTTFGLPDGRGRAFFGADNIGGTFATVLGNNSSVGGITGPAIIGTTGGAQTHVQTAAELAAHTHVVALQSGVDAMSTGGPVSGADNTNSGGAGSSTPFNITPPAFVGNWLIKR
jgi:hypothetical protein